MLCPRKCGINRHERPGYCGMKSEICAARAGLHFFEEPYISGEAGSGTVFFSGCSLKCIFCQNWQISRDGYGKEISTGRLAEIFLEQQERGALNINLVTGTHFTPSIAEALKKAKDEGLKIPVLWNSSGYEEVDTLKMLEGLVDIWLPDFKTLDSELAKKYFNAPDYPMTVMKALDYMVSVSPEPIFSGDLLVSGVNAFIELTLRILQPSRPTICRAKACVGIRVPKKFRPKTNSTPDLSRSKKLLVSLSISPSS